MSSISNLDRYRADLKRLIERSDTLDLAFKRHVNQAAVDKQVRDRLGEEQAKVLIADIPAFGPAYEAWYSEALALIRQVIPHRVEDFRAHYERPKNRRDITVANYVIDDAIQGLKISFGSTVRAEPQSAIPRFQSQTSILKACEARFESTLFDIRQLVQADVFDDELSAARELIRNKFTRAAGAVAGVVLEHHLQQVLANHGLSIPKKNPTLGDLSQALKDGDVVDTAGWRRLQHLGDIRNKCDHKKAAEPTVEEVNDLIDGVERTIKNLF